MPTAGRRAQALQSFVGFRLNCCGDRNGYAGTGARYVTLHNIHYTQLVIALGILGQHRLVPLHQTSDFLWRRRLMAVEAGVTRAASIWRLPSARIFRRAMVSCVSSYDAIS